MPCDYKRYHPDWKNIRLRVRLGRANNRCERCGIANYSVVQYLDNCPVRVIPQTSYRAARAEATRLGQGCFRVRKGKAWFGEWYRVVVLTVAHLDHDIKNNDLSNLQCLCQRCHLGHDKRDNWQRRRYGPTGQFYNQTKIPL